MMYEGTPEAMDEIRQLLDEITDHLAAMTREQRLAWFQRSMYAKPLNFMREIDGTTYVVRTYFREDATENIKDKIERIVTKREAT